jgi:hypothetical protein
LPFWSGVGCTALTIGSIAAPPSDWAETHNWLAEVGGVPEPCG